MQSGHRNQRKDISSLSFFLSSLLPPSRPLSSPSILLFLACSTHHAYLDPMHYGKDSRLQDQKNMIVDSFSSVGTFFPVLVSIAPVFCSEASSDTISYVFPCSSVNLMMVTYAHASMATFCF